MSCPQLAYCVPQKQPVSLAGLTAAGQPLGGSISQTMSNSRKRNSVILKGCSWFPTSLFCVLGVGAWGGQGAPANN